MKFIISNNPNTSSDLRLYIVRGIERTILIVETSIEQCRQHIPDYNSIEELDLGRYIAFKYNMVKGKELLRCDKGIRAVLHSGYFEFVNL